MTPPIALQLYTVRDILAQDFAATIEKIAEMGYVGVETAFFSDNITINEAAKVIKSMGLSVPSAHCELPLEEQQQVVLDQVAAFDCQRIVWHGWPQDRDYSSVEGVKRLAERYNRANAAAQARGLSFGLHNHWWEFEAVEDQYPYQILLEHMEPDIFFEVDTYWVKTAGLDPVSVVAELGSRAPLLHIKDGPALKDEPMLAAGQGVMDFQAIQQAAGQVTEWMIVELDACATDMLEAVAQSYQYLTQNGLAQGQR